MNLFTIFKPLLSVNYQTVISVSWFIFILFFIILPHTVAGKSPRSRAYEE